MKPDIQKILEEVIHKGMQFNNIKHITYENIEDFSRCSRQLQTYLIQLVDDEQLKEKLASIKLLQLKESEATAIDAKNYDSFKLREHYKDEIQRICNIYSSIALQEE